MCTGSKPVRRRFTLVQTIQRGWLITCRSCRALRSFRERCCLSLIAIWLNLLRVSSGRLSGLQILFPQTDANGNVNDDVWLAGSRQKRNRELGGDSINRAFAHPPYLLISTI